MRRARARALWRAVVQSDRAGRVADGGRGAGGSV